MNEPNRSDARNQAAEGKRRGKERRVRAQYSSLCYDTSPPALLGQSRSQTNLNAIENCRQHGNKVVFVHSVGKSAIQSWSELME